MQDAIVHRGPDEHGVWREGGVFLGSRRLRIIDLSNGRMPIANEDGTVVVTYNGEIYNFAELRRDLERKGHRFRTRTDTETIIHLYEERGPDLVQELRGMFAFALWDVRRRRLLLARDRLGEKPLYYWEDERGIVFGSELDPVLAHPLVPRRLDPTALSDYLTFLYVPAPKTIYRDVRKLPPGHTLEVTEQGATLRRYWRPSFARTRRESEAALADELRERLREAVRMRLVSEVPLGAFLSGGIDSSTVVALMAEAMDRPVTTVSIGFPEASHDETAAARATAAALRTDHHEHRVTPDAVATVERLAAHYGEPFADASAVPTFHVSRVARERVTVALSGDGGDENFAGYRRYFYQRLECRLRALFPAALRRPVLGALSGLYPKADWLPRPLRAKTLLRNLSLEAEEAYYRSVTAIADDEKDALIAAPLRGALRGYSSRAAFLERFREADTEDPLARAQYVDLVTYLPDDILAKVDRASMAVSLEARVPLLDHPLVEFAASLPSGLKLKGGASKHLLRRAVAGLVPDEVFRRRKQGFEMPLRRWFRRELVDVARGAIACVAEAGLLERAPLERALEDHVRGLRDRSTLLWTVVALAAWQRREARVPVPASVA
jgi:asparagine synthase (glutamine-hydrolysing)